ncbi:MAG: hypothetical protein LBV28_00205 [Puniceicoccales bacterium]|jgi:hypothetical protein|nr:hypothetical protein [Puniceicoccales bacterium]
MILTLPRFHIRRVLPCLVAAFSFLILAPVLNGQAAKDVPMMSIRFSAISLDDTIKDLNYASGTKSTPVTIPVEYKPVPVSYNGPVPLVFFRESKDEKGKPIRTPVVEITPPQRSGVWLILLKRLPGATERYAAMVVPDQDGPTSGNSWCFINFSKQPIAVDLEKKKAEIASGKSVLLNMGTEAVYMMGKIYKRQGSAWVQGYGTRFRHHPGRPRTYMLFDDPTDPSHLILKGIPNTVPPPKPKEDDKKPAAAGAARTRRP